MNTYHERRIAKIYGVVMGHAKALGLGHFRQADVYTKLSWIAYFPEPIMQIIAKGKRHAEELARVNRVNTTRREAREFAEDRQREQADEYTATSQEDTP